MTRGDDVRLTQLAAAAGCAAKLGQQMLRDVFARLPTPPRDARVLVNASTFDDAGVYILRADCALVQTVDFFTPIVDDPRDFGRIAAANALSDVYAMGGRPITALNLLGVPVDKLDARAIAAILRGGATVVRAAGCALVGGHTIKTAEPIYGLSVTGVVDPKRLLTNATARPGDLLVLTKPLGTGIVTTALKRGLASDALVRRAVRSMTTLNDVGATLAERGVVRCATDITGFGLLGHLGNILRASGVGAEINVGRVPMLARDVSRLIDARCVPGGTRANLDASNAFVDWGDATEAQKTLLADAQTSGPLLLCVGPKRVDKVINMLKEHRTLASAIIGRIMRGSPRVRVARVFNP